MPVVAGEVHTLTEITCRQCGKDRRETINTIFLLACFSSNACSFMESIGNYIYVYGHLGKTAGDS